LKWRINHSSISVVMQYIVIQQCLFSSHLLKKTIHPIKGTRYLQYTWKVCTFFWRCIFFSL